MVFLETYRRYVSADGLVFMISGGKLKECKQHLSHGYPNVSVYRPTAGRSCINVHQLVAMAFCPNPNGFTEIDHIDRNKMNANRANLRWCDRQTNNLNKACVDKLKALGLRSRTKEYSHWWYENNKEQHNKKAMDRYYAKKRGEA